MLTQSKQECASVFVGKDDTETYLHVDMATANELQSNRIESNRIESNRNVVNRLKGCK